MPTSYVDDRPPTAVADAITMSANQAALDTQVTTTYVDADGVTQTVVQDVFGTTIDVLGNDTDPDAGDAGKFWIFDFSQPVDAQGNSAGTLTVEKDSNGHDVLRFYDADPALQNGVHTVTFTYSAADQWAVKTDPNTWPTTVSQPVTVTITITGNSTPGETICAGNRNDVVDGGGGNDLLMGGNGKDTVIGEAGADTLAGGDGKDLVQGGDGNDRLYGGSYRGDCERQNGHHDDHHDRHDDHNYNHHDDDRGDAPDTLNGGAGDDTLTGGHGPDRFVFDYGFGHDVVTDFDSHNDKIVVDHNMWASFDDLKAHAVQMADHSVVLTSDFGDFTITLLNTCLRDLQSRDFLFT